LINSINASRVAPGTWWLLALTLMIVAGASSSFVTLTVIGLAAVLAVIIFREDAPWSRSIKFYLLLATIVVLIRILFRILFNIQDPNDLTVLNLPQLSINLGFGPEIQLLGQVGSGALLDGLTDGLRLAAIILSVAMASSLANPRKLLKSTPGILYEVASSVSVAINLAPQLIASLQRVRKARELRGRSKGLSQLAGIVIPVLEDAIDSSLALAASMDARGIGRKGQMTNLQITIARSSSLSAIALLAIGSFMLLSGGIQVLGVLLIVLALVATFISVKITSKANIRTRYEPTKFSSTDWMLIALAIALVIAALGGLIP